MARSRPTAELIEYDPAALGKILDELIIAGQGWVNVLPEIPEDVPVPSTPGVLAVFSKRGPVVPLGTWVTPQIAKNGVVEPIDIGIQHGTAKLAADALSETPGDIPEGWRKVTDSPRRGIVVRAAADATTVDHARWLLDALTALCIPPTTGKFVLFRYTG